MVIALLLLLFADPAALLQEAKGSLAKPGQHDRNVALLRDANRQWQALSDRSAPYTESLILFAGLARLDAPNEARAAAQQAVANLSGEPGSDETNALANEVLADAIGRPDPAAEAAWQKAFVLRQKRVAAIGMPAGQASGQPQRIGPGVAAPLLTSRKEPEYTPPALIRKLQGSVLLQILVSESGLPMQFQLLRGLGYGLDESAAEAVLHWRFRPGTRDGVAVPVIARIEINFRLLDGAPQP